VTDYTEITCEGPKRLAIVSDLRFTATQEIQSAKDPLPQATELEK
jgi:hypothetical protein